MKKCLSCGFENIDENNFCAKCGRTLTPNEVVQTSTGSQPNSQTHVSPAVFIVGIVILFSVVGGIIWYSTMLSIPGMSTATFNVVIQSDTSWSGSIGGGTSSRTIQGDGSETWEITGTMAVAVIQKQTSDGYLTVKITRNGNVVAQQSTTADYGVVTVSATS